MKPGEVAYRRAARQAEWRIGLFVGGSFAGLLIGAELFGRGVAMVLNVPSTMFNDAIVLRITPVLSFMLLIYFCVWHKGVGAFASGRPAQWLRGSPWRPGRPLHLYPSVLPLRHGLAVGLATVSIALYSQTLVWMPVGALMAAVLIRVVILNLLSRRPTALAGSFLIACGAMLAIPLAAKLALLAVAVVVLLWGTRRFEKGFMLIEPAPTHSLFRGHPGWLLRQAPKIETTPNPAGTGVLIGLASFWVVFCGMHGMRLNASDGRFATGLAFIVTLVIPLVRWATYVSRDNAPISTMGRLRQGVLLIPSHDRALVAPLLSLACTGLALAVCIWTDAWDGFTAALLPALAITICLDVGPSLRHWRLTGLHNSTRLALREIAVKGIESKP